MKVRKKPIVISYRIASGMEVIQTLEGPVTAQPGDAVITGVVGEQYPLPRPRFDAFYTVVEPGKAVRNPMVVEAKRMDREFEVQVSWARETIKGKPGDYLLTFGPDDHGPVAAEVFAESYEILEE